MDLNSLTYTPSLKGKALRVLITGMSGTGKSTTLEKLGKRECMLWFYLCSDNFGKFHT